METPPKSYNLEVALRLLSDINLQPTLKKIDDAYMHWEKVKYNVPSPYEPENVWQAVKAKRSLNARFIRFGGKLFRFTITEHMQELLHEFDMQFGGTLSSVAPVPESGQHNFLINSLMEEAIASSQMEGASTTRRVAKDMLRRKSAPQNKSQQMILNNYFTIQWLVEHQLGDFTIDSVLEVHRRISQSTLDNPADAGRIRQDDKVQVVNGITGDVAHIPPTHTMVEHMLQQMCDFANGQYGEGFIHPIVKAIIIHFLLAYIHPFADGNGRTARSLFYWYMLKNNYWLTQYLTISLIIYKSKKSYERAYLYTESDDLDLSYFIQYNLEAMKKAYAELKAYLQKKISENEDKRLLRYIPGINERQAQILQEILKRPDEILIPKEISAQFAVTDKTIRKDLQDLVQLGYLAVRPLNQRKTGYVKSEHFDELIQAAK